MGCNSSDVPSCYRTYILVLRHLAPAKGSAFRYSFLLYSSLRAVDLLPATLGFQVCGRLESLPLRLCYFPATIWELFSLTVNLQAQ